LLAPLYNVGGGGGELLFKVRRICLTCDRERNGQVEKVRLWLSREREKGREWNCCWERETGRDEMSEWLCVCVLKREEKKR